MTSTVLPYQPELNKARRKKRRRISSRQRKEKVNQRKPFRKFIAAHQKKKTKK